MSRTDARRAAVNHDESTYSHDEDQEGMDSAEEGSLGDYSSDSNDGDGGSP